MKYAEAFRALGYRLPSPRQDWSAIGDNGVCLSLWRVELSSRGQAPWFDTKLHGRPIVEWGFKPGNKLRLAHLQVAVSKFGGAIDVVLVSGNPGEGFGDAAPWNAAQRKGRWRVVGYDDTGHFEAEVVRE